MEKLRNALTQLNIEYTEGMIDQFKGYMDGILEKNQFINLTAITDSDEFVVKHFIDSVLSAPAEEVKRAETIIDVGTGAGFPGIPLAIIFPDKKFVLMDSLAKRLKIIDELCGQLGITNVTTVHARAEEMARMKEHREKYDLCIARAVANMATLSEYCLPFIAKGGYFLAYKGPDYAEELKAAKNAVRILGGEVKDVRYASLPDFDLDHKIVYIEKTGMTPAKYPRKAGTPSKEPLR